MSAHRCEFFPTGNLTCVGEVTAMVVIPDVGAAMLCEHHAAVVRQHRRALIEAESS